MSKQFAIRYPFEGLPVPIKRVGLFAYHPEVYIKLVGISQQGAFARKGLANQHRRLMRLTHAVPAFPREKLALKVFEEIADDLRPDAERPPLLDDVLKAFRGDKAARARLESLTCVEALLSGLGTEMSSWKRRHCHLIVLERAGVHAQLLLEAGDVQGAANFIAGHPLLQALIWPEALEVLRGAPSLHALSPLTASMALDAHLGWLAAWELDYAELKGVESPHFACLLPSRTQPGRNPTSLFFDELKRQLGASTVSDILDSCKLAPDVEIGTLYQWSAGRHFPDLETMAILMKAHGLHNQDDLLYWQFHAAKLINLLAYLGQTIATKTRENGEPSALWPWPAYPFGHPNFECWAAARYPFWLNYHRNNGASLVKLAKTAHGLNSL